FTAGHHYSLGGACTVSVTLADKDGGSITRTTTAVTASFGSVSLIAGTLYVVGTDGKDIIDINTRQNGRIISVATTFQVGTRGSKPTIVTFESSQVNQIVILSGGGDDVIRIAKDLRIGATVLVAEALAHRKVR